MLFAVIAGAAVVAALPSIPGGLAATTVSAGCYVVLRGKAGTAQPRSHAHNPLSRIRSSAVGVGRVSAADPALPFAIDLLAVCLRGGTPTSAGLRAVAGVLSRDEHVRPANANGSTASAVSAVFARVAAASELGSEPASAWAGSITHPVYGPLARALVVTGESGSAVAGRLESVSQRLRAVAGQQAMIRAQRAGVALMAPLGLCFLPAFVCLCVVPVVVGIAGRVFG